MAESLFSTDLALVPFPGGPRQACSRPQPPGASRVRRWQPAPKEPRPPACLPAGPRRRGWGMNEAAHGTQNAASQTTLSQAAQLP